MKSQPSHLEHFEELAPRFDVQRKKQAYYYSLLLQWLHYVVPEGQHVMELGCADGGLLMALKPSHAIGLEFSPRFIKLAQERHPQGRWVLVDITHDLPPMAANADYIIGLDILGYLEDIQPAMENVARLCASNTRVVLTKTNPFWGPLFRCAAWFGLTEPRRYSNWLNQRQCQAVLELSGFEVIKTGKFCLLPIYIPVVSAICNRVLAHLPGFRWLALVEYFICRKRPDHLPVEQPSVSVIIPVRDEQGNIRAALERMPRFPGPLEVIFIEGHSSDGTWDEIHRLMSAQAWPFSLRAYRQTGKGKGDAVRLGFSLAQHDILMILDADLTVRPEELPRFYDILADRRAEYVHGTRLVYPMEAGAMRPLNWLGNKLFSAVFSFLLNQNLSDTLCGTKCLRRSAYEELARQRVYFGEFDPFGDFDLIFGAAKLSLKLAEIPVHYKERLYGETKIRRFREGLLLFRMCLVAARKMFFI